MRKIIFLLLLSPIFGFSQSPDGTFKTITATMPTADNYVISEPLPAAYDPKEKFIVVFPSANTTTSPTLNRNSLGTKAIKNEDGTSPAIGAICACRKLLSYNGTYFQIVGGGAATGITNSAAANELMKSDGTNAVASGIFSTTAGNINLGTGISGASRTIQADGSSTDVSLNILGKGAGTITLTTNGTTYNFNGSTFNLFSSTASLSGAGGLFTISSASANPGKAIKLLSGDGASAGQPSGNVTISSGNGVTTGNSGTLNLNTGTGGNATGDINIITGNATTTSGNILLQSGTGTTRGNIALFSSTGSFGSGQQVSFVHDAAVNPSTNPTAGFILYSDAGNSSHPTVKLPSGSTVDLTAGSGGTITSIGTTSPITGGPITTTGTIACATCVTSAASLTSNALMIGGGLQASSTTTTGTGILTWIGTPSSANLAAALTDETGTGADVFAGSPTFTGTPTLGTLGYSDTGILWSMQSSTNSYNQLILQNTSNGASASTNLIISSDNGTSTTHFLEVGKNSSGFTGSGSFNLASASYIDDASDDLVIGTLSNKTLHFVTNGATTDNLSITGAGVMTFNGSSTAIHKELFPSLGITQTDGAGMWFQNSTAATNGAQQISPLITLEGQGFATGLTSQSVKFAQDVLPVQAATNPTGTWRLRQSINGAAYTDVMTMTSTGVLTVGSGTSFINSNSSTIVLQGSSSEGARFANIGSKYGLLLGSTTSNGMFYAVVPAMASFWVEGLRVDAGAFTALTANTEFRHTSSRGATWTWVDGTVATQRMNYDQSFVLNGTTTLATFTNAYGRYTEAPTFGAKGAGTAWAQGFKGNIQLVDAGNKIFITEGSNGSVGQTTLVSGTKAVTVTGTTTSSRCFATLVTPSGTTLTTTYQCVCTSNTVTIQANVAAGTINTADGSTVNYWIVN